MNCHDLILTSECHKVSELQRLIDIMAHLRGPDGCPWDQEQTHQTLTRCLVEEVSETWRLLTTTTWFSLRKSWGTYYYKWCFMLRLPEKKNKFDLEDVARGISDKLIKETSPCFR